jgi:hypothetical protein
MDGLFKRIANYYNLIKHAIDCGISSLIIIIKGSMIV